MRNISRRGVMIISDSATDLERLEAEVGWSELRKDPSISKRERRDSEILIGSARSRFRSLELHSRWKGVQRCGFFGSGVAQASCCNEEIELGRCKTIFKVSRRPLLCYRCWKYGKDAVGTVTVKNMFGKITPDDPCVQTDPSLNRGA